MGCDKAHAFLKTPGIFGLAGSLRYTPASNQGRDQTLATQKLRQMYRHIREQVRDQIPDRFNEILMQAGVKGFIWGTALRGIADSIVKPKLNKLPEL